MRRPQPLQSSDTSPKGSMGLGLLPMGVANLVSLLAALGGYLFYSRILSPSDFGLYATAMALAKAGTTVLDGGVRTALIKQNFAVSRSVERTLFVASLLFAGICTTVLFLSLQGLHSFNKVDGTSYALFLLYASAYFLTYPFILIPLAKLERDCQFLPVAWAEGLSITIEYALPAVLWACAGWGFWSFIISAWIARLVRLAILQVAKPITPLFSRPFTLDWPGAKRTMAEGAGIQIATALSFFRDSLHIIVVGPLFGKEWVGHYAWAMQLCGVASQIAVQTATRIGLPALKFHANSLARWNAVIRQIIFLSIFTVPSLVFLQVIATPLDHLFFQGKWQTALAILPFLVIRMLPGIATTSLSALVLTEMGGATYARSLGLWTLIETAGAIVFIALFKEWGLAISYSLFAWCGVIALAYALGMKGGLPKILNALLLRPSTWVALLFLGIYQGLVATQYIDASQDILKIFIFVSVATLLSILTEKVVRELIHDHIIRKLRHG